MTGILFDIKEMAVHDGPGIRTTVFLKGCPLRCKWCHNPEGFSFRPQPLFKEARCVQCNQCRTPCAHSECQPFGRCIHRCPHDCFEISGKEFDIPTLLAILQKNAAVLGDSFGGFTFSGGEPLAQPEFLGSLLDALQGYHLCIETSGYAPSEIFSETIGKLQFVIMDIKLADSATHKQYTGVGNELIVQNFKILKNSGKPYLIRTPLIPGVTDTKENIAAIQKLIENSPWEQLPYNAMTGAKYRMLGMPFSDFDSPRRS